MLQFFRKPALSDSAVKQIILETKESLRTEIDEIATEWCFYVQTTEALDKRESAILQWLLAETFARENFSNRSFLKDYPTQLEVGPRLNFETAWSSTAVSICLSCGFSKIVRIERSLRFGLSTELKPDEITAFLTPLHDRMTQVRYPEPLKSFDSGLKPKAVRIIPVIEKGIEALRTINQELGLAMDEQDLEIDAHLFVKKLGRNPTDVELFQLGQSISEHSRHRYFKGKLVINGKPMENTLMEIIKTPWLFNSKNSLIAFCDDSSAIRGAEIETLILARPGECSPFILDKCFYHPTLTAETHNFPSGVAPFPGAETGTGGRIRDNQAVGRGGLVVAGGAAYCVDNLHIPGLQFPWEEDGWFHPSNLASPLRILIGASDGASDYGNKFGEPVIYGFTRTCGIELPDGRRGWFKPIMYTVGAGQMDNLHTQKGKPQKGQLVVQIGGPAYRIGLGGASASSMIQGDNVEVLDFNAVQRGDAQMEQRMNRLIRACIELRKENPFVSIHDLGAGGDCNALPELVDPAGAKINLRAIPLGDQSLSVLEYWGNESQERHVFLIWPERFPQIKAICQREGIPCVIVGQITGDGWFRVYDEKDGSFPVNLPLKEVLGELPPKTFELERIPAERTALQLPENLSFSEALERVLRLLSVGSKRFLTTKVDRSVTGLIAQQQCVGPNHLTLSDFAVIAQSLFGLSGVALSLGEQPIKGLIDSQAMARLAVAEALLNMVGAKITDLWDIDCSANWMLAAKLPGEGAWLYDAACSLKDICLEVGMIPDGGKDSLSMAAKTLSPQGKVEVVKAPGELVIAAYAPMPDITCKVTADLKEPGNTVLYIDLAKGNCRLGGSALAQVYGQVGDDCPDVEDTDLLTHTFRTIQGLVEKGLVLSVHDRSDGGLIVTLLEMAFAGNVGLDINFQTKETNPIKAFFNEEIGLVIECQKFDKVEEILRVYGIPFKNIGKVAPQDNIEIVIKHNGTEVLREKMLYLRQIWEETSSQIDKLQANPSCVEEETKNNAKVVTAPQYRLSFTPEPTSEVLLSASQKPKVAILRTEGSNGDREMASAFYLAGFETWDVTMTDLLSNKANLDDFRGVAFVGGFAFADVLDAGKGWAGIIHFNEEVTEQFKRFYERKDTFSLGVCNGCQLMALMGWVPWSGLKDEEQPRFIRNESERFESRFVTVEVTPSPAIMLQGMENSILGVWVAHGEGQFYLPKDELLYEIYEKELACLYFADNLGISTHTYPFNPNGSTEGITALCSPDGRHLAMMPHPERTFLRWQWPYWPKEWLKLKVSPWLRLFQNAREWCENH